MMRTEVVADCYVDSVRLLEATRAMREATGVDWAWALMATPANLDALAAEGLTDQLSGAAANDLVLAVRGSGDELTAALEAGRRMLFEATEPGGAAHSMPAGTRLPASTTLWPRLPMPTSPSSRSPGPYAALEAHKALTRGLDVLLFSDNVPWPTRSV